MYQLHICRMRNVLGRDEIEECEMDIFWHWKTGLRSFTGMWLGGNGVEMAFISASVADVAGCHQSTRACGVSLRSGDVSPGNVRAAGLQSSGRSSDQCQHRSAG